MKFLIFFVCFSLSIFAFGGYEWKNVSQEDRIGGRMISAGYLRGKVVLIDSRNYGDASKKNREEMLQLQNIWAAYKTKPFILLGCHTSEADKKRATVLAKKLGLTFPIYDAAHLQWSDFQPNIKFSDFDPTIGETTLKDQKGLILIDSTARRRLFKGTDPRAASGAVGNALIGVSTPMTPKQFNFLLEYETRCLPGRAFLRLREFRTRFPIDAETWNDKWKELSEDNDVRRLAKLVEMAELVKDRNVADEAAKKLTPAILKKNMTKYDDLKNHKNPFIAQEAKNALADITWSSATL